MKNPLVLAFCTCVICGTMVLIFGSPENAAIVKNLGSTAALLFFLLFLFS